MHPTQFIKRQIPVCVEVFCFNQISVVIITICPTRDALFVWTRVSILVKIDYFNNTTILVKRVLKTGNTLFVSCGDVVGSFLEAFFYYATFRVSKETHIANLAAVSFLRGIEKRICQRGYIAQNCGRCGFVISQ